MGSLKTVNFNNKRMKIELVEVGMYDKLGEVVLKTDERMEVGLITAPDAPHAEEVKQFLGHKGGNWEWHIQRCVTEVLDALETRFYVGKVDGRVITNIMTVEHEGVGILGHVFTLPQERRKGACKGVMGYQMEDFRERTGRALYLGTGYNSHPFYIYHSFGFESVFPESGFMKYYVNRILKNTTSLPRLRHRSRLNGTIGRRLQRYQGLLDGMRCGVSHGRFTVRQIWKVPFWALNML